MNNTLVVVFAALMCGGVDMARAGAADALSGTAASQQAVKSVEYATLIPSRYEQLGMAFAKSSADLKRKDLLRDKGRPRTFKGVFFATEKNPNNVPNQAIERRVRIARAEADNSIDVSVYKGNTEMLDTDGNPAFNIAVFQNRMLAQNTASNGGVCFMDKPSINEHTVVFKATDGDFAGKLIVFYGGMRGFLTAVPEVETVSEYEKLELAFLKPSYALTAKELVGHHSGTFFPSGRSMENPNANREMDRSAKIAIAECADCGQLTKNTITLSLTHSGKPVGSTKRLTRRETSDGGVYFMDEASSKAGPNSVIIFKATTGEYAGKVVVFYNQMHGVI